MTVYVDSHAAKLGRMVMCHMVADTEEELREMAEALGLGQYVHRSRSGVLHLDVCLKKRAEAVARGAREVGWREMARLCRASRGA